MKAHVDLAQELGFETAATNANADYALAKKLLIAYATFKVVTKDQIDTFNADLKKKTMSRQDEYTRTYKQLKLVPVAKYASLPPLDVLEAIKSARSTSLFDTFEIAYIVDHKEVRDPDPIVFGLISGCTDYFFIAQWGDDVKVTDLLKSEQEATK